MDPHANNVPATDPPTPDPVSFNSAKVDSDMLSSKPASDVPTILPIWNAPGQSTVVNPSADDITVPLATFLIIVSQGSLRLSLEPIVCFWSNLLQYYHRRSLYLLSKDLHIHPSTMTTNHIR
jgi:hypothetical protein